MSDKEEHSYIEQEYCHWIIEEPQDEYGVYTVCGGTEEYDEIRRKSECLCEWVREYEEYVMYRLYMHSSRVPRECGYRGQQTTSQRVWL